MLQRRSRGPSAGKRSFAGNRADLHQRLTVTTAALKRNRAARNRHQTQRARLGMRTWQVECRKRTRHLMELGGLVVKARVVDLTGDDRAMIYGALIWVAEKLSSEQSEQARKLWAGKGKCAFEAEHSADARNKPQPPQDQV